MNDTPSIKSTRTLLSMRTSQTMASSTSTAVCRALLKAPPLQCAERKRWHKPCRTKNVRTKRPAKLVFASCNTDGRLLRLMPLLLGGARQSALMTKASLQLAAYAVAARDVADAAQRESTVTRSTAGSCPRNQWFIARCAEFVNYARPVIQTRRPG